jgi:hypothetical protein
MREGTEEEAGQFITAAIDESRFSEEAMKPYGGKSMNSLIHACHNELHFVLPQAATAAYLRQQTRYLNIVREQLKESHSKSFNLKRTLHTIGEFFDRTLGVPALARELAGKSKSQNWYPGEYEFTAPSWTSQALPQQLSEILRSSTNFMATRLAQDETVMREHFAQVSSILSTRENIKVQHRMELLTVVAVVVAVLSLLVALVGPHKLAEWLNSFLLYER